MRILVDTNLFARLAQPSHRHHTVARQALEILRTGNHELCTVPQVLYEFWVVGTRPPAENGLGMSVAEALSEVGEIKALFRLLRDERAIYPAWEQLVKAHDVKGKKAHDARLVAAMNRHRLTHLLTFNPDDFLRYSGITVLTPEAVMQNQST